LPYSTEMRALIAYIIFAPLLNLGLIIFLSRRLHRRHAGRYTPRDIAWKIIYPRLESSVDADHDLLNDLKPIQRWNLFANLIIVLIAALLVIVLRRS
jgi:hypothetical protein